MKHLICLILAVVFIVGITTGGRSAPPETDTPAAETVMQAKLRVSRTLLAALAEQDYSHIEDGADALAQLARGAAWDAKRSKSYERSSVEFERSAYQLAQAAQQKNQDGTVLAYFNMTFACLNCHQSLRDQNRPAGDKIASSINKVPDREHQDLNFWMKKKIEFAETALTAICLADFDNLIEASQQMSRLGKVEGWARRTDAREYRVALADFEEANQHLRRAAARKSVDSAALAFTNLTFSCVRCHTALRSETNKDSKHQ